MTFLISLKNNNKNELNKLIKLTKSQKVKAISTK